MDKKRTIEIELDVAKKWYKGKDKVLKKLALQAFNKYELMDNILPVSFKDYFNDYSTNENADKYLENEINLLNELLVIRDIYRQGWKYNLGSNDVAYCIEYDCDGNLVSIPYWSGEQNIFSFPTEGLTNLFIKNFEAELKQLIKIL